MDILTALDEHSKHSTRRLQLIIGAWVVSALFERASKVAHDTGDVDEDDYTKQSIYSLLYSIYASMGVVESERGEPYEFTFNTWGYTWPEALGVNPTTHEHDPQRFGKNAYTGLLEFEPVKARIREREGKVHMVELGCGTGAGAHHICKHVLPECTYEAVDMQAAAISTLRRRHAPELNGRLVARHADCTRADIPAETADIVGICETHVTEYRGHASDEDKRFFDAVARIAKPGGFLVWGNAIPDSTWEPCFEYLESIGMTQVDGRDVTREAVAARDQDWGRVEAYVAQCMDKWLAFRIPFLGPKRRRIAEVALKNFFRHPGTNLYESMVTRDHTYRVVCFQKQ